ncbi:MAG: M20/M25/M40 family metallo-hydrolase [Anaerolineales bacterium]
MNQSVTERFKAALLEERERVTHLISDLVRIPSVNDESGVQNYIEQFFSAMEFSIDVWEPLVQELSHHPAFVPVDYDYTERKNMVVVIKGQGGGRSLTLNGHMDVVPADPAGVWKHTDPFSGAIDNHRVFGRGSVDMKAGLAIMMVLAKVLRDLQIKPLSPLRREIWRLGDLLPEICWYSHVTRQRATGTSTLRSCNEATKLGGSNSKFRPEKADFRHPI